MLKEARSELHEKFARLARGPGGRLVGEHEEGSPITRAQSTNIAANSDLSTTTARPRAAAAVLLGSAPACVARADLAAATTSCAARASAPNRRPELLWDGRSAALGRRHDGRPRGRRPAGRLAVSPRLERSDVLAARSPPDQPTAPEENVNCSPGHRGLEARDDSGAAKAHHVTAGASRSWAGWCHGAGLDRPVSRPRAVRPAESPAVLPAPRARGCGLRRHRAAGVGPGPVQSGSVAPNRPLARAPRGDVMSFAAPESSPDALETRWAAVRQLTFCLRCGGACSGGRSGRRARRPASSRGS